jgi:hypothetical protein
MDETWHETEKEKEGAEQSDYLKAVFEAIEKANVEMNKYGVTLSWEFKITPYYPPVKRSLNSL